MQVLKPDWPDPELPRAHASYLIGDPSSGTAVVVDPQRDIDAYVADAEKAGLQIRHVFLTHFHADFLAGHLELRDRTGARIHLGAKAQAEFAFTADGRRRQPRSRTRAADGARNAGPHGRIDLDSRVRPRRRCPSAAGDPDRRHVVRGRRRSSGSARVAGMVGERSGKDAVSLGPRRSCCRCQTPRWSIRRTAPARCAARA